MDIKDDNFKLIIDDEEILVGKNYKIVVRGLAGHNLTFTGTIHAIHFRYSLLELDTSETFKMSLTQIYFNNIKSITLI